MIVTSEDMRWSVGAAKHDVLVDSYRYEGDKAVYEGQECMIASLVVDGKADRTIVRSASNHFTIHIYRTLKTREDAIAYVNRKRNSRAGMGRKLDKWSLVVPVGKENEF